MDEKPTEPAEPVAPEMPTNVSSSTEPAQTAAVSVPPTGPQPVIADQKKSRPKWLMPIILVGALLLGGGAAAYLTVFNKSPEELFASALKNTANGFETFLNIDNEQAGVKLDGSFDLSSPLAVDGTLAGQWNGSNGSLTANLGAAGARVEAEIRTIAVENSATPDIYFNLSGLEGISGIIGLVGGVDPQVDSLLSEVNGQWYVVDHTLLDQFTASSGGDSSVTELSEDEIRGINEAVVTVVRERLFGTEDDKAVFQINEEIGSEEFEGTDTYKLDVGVNKDNFVAFLQSFEGVINDTALKSVLESAAPGQSVEELIDFSAVEEALADVDFTQARADVWVEGNGRFIRNVRIYASDDKTNYLDFMLPYEGGDVFPLVLRATVNEEGTEGSLSFGVDLNQSNGDSRLWFDVDLSNEGVAIDADGELSLTATSEDVSVEAPSAARNVFDLLGGLDLGSTGTDDFESLADFPAVESLDSPVFDDIEIQAN